MSKWKYNSEWPEGGAGSIMYMPHFNGSDNDHLLRDNVYRVCSESLLFNCWWRWVLFMSKWRYNSGRLVYRMYMPYRVRRDSVCGVCNELYMDWFSVCCMSKWRYSHGTSGVAMYMPSHTHRDKV
jgi:hypothetical protein